MPGNYRYEEERNRGQRGARRGGFFGRGRDDDDFEQQEHERFAGGPDYDRERSGYERPRGRQDVGRDAGRSLGASESFEGWDEDDNLGASQGGSGRGATRHAGGPGGEYDRGGRSRYGGPRGGGSMQADGWTAEPEEMRWGRQQGLYGSSEYSGYVASQRSQADFRSHVGKGPRGWQRSDERIREDLNEALARHPEIDATDIEVQVQGGEITLSGTVTDRRTKRLAEDVAERVFGARDVQNQIRVKPSMEGPAHDRYGEREVTRAPDREGRAGLEGQEGRAGKTGTSSTGGNAPR